MAAHPTLAVPIAGAAAGPDAWFPLVASRVVNRQRQSVLLTSATAEEAADMPLEEMLDQVGDDDAPREMFVGEVFGVSARSAWDSKLIALGRSLAAGVLSPDQATFEHEAQFVRTLARIEAPHVRVLDVIGQDLPHRGVRRALVQGWEISDVANAVPEYCDIAVQLVAVLESEGLISDSAMSPVQGPQYLVSGGGPELLDRVASASEPEAIEPA